MTLHDDPITSLALTPRRQSAALAALPWAEDEARWQNRMIVSVAVAAFVSLFCFLI